MTKIVRLHGTLEELKQAKEIMYNKYNVIGDAGPFKEENQDEYSHSYYCNETEDLKKLFAEQNK